MKQGIAYIYNKVSQQMIKMITRLHEINVMLLYVNHKLRVFL